MPKKKAPIENQPNSPVTKDISGTRYINAFDSTILYVRAGGRCEFDGCNRYLLEHPLTKREGNYGQKAHIVAFRLKGSRGDYVDRPEKIHILENLMLLCPFCHKEIDDNPETYTVEALRRQKESHEERVFLATSWKPERETHIVILKAKIGEHSISIPLGDMVEAIAPNYPADSRGCLIDLGQLDDQGPEFFELGCKEIKRKLNQFYEEDLAQKKVSRISVFAFAPMPLLIYLGSLLSNKVTTDLFQRHRDNEKWGWKNSGEPVDYDFEHLRRGKDITKVALICALSAPIGLPKLPLEIDQSFSVYRLTLKNHEPEPTFLKLKEDLDRFRIKYQIALRTIENNHGTLKELHFFPAVPAPIAVLCGRELMPKNDPALVVYDNDKRLNGFRRIFEVHPLREQETR